MEPFVNLEVDAVFFCIGFALLCFDICLQIYDQTQVCPDVKGSRSDPCHSHKTGRSLLWASQTHSYAQESRHHRHYPSGAHTAKEEAKAVSVHKHIEMTVIITVSYSLSTD